MRVTPMLGRVNSRYRPGKGPKKLIAFEAIPITEKTKLFSVDQAAK